MYRSPRLKEKGRKVSVSRFAAFLICRTPSESLPQVRLVSYVDEFSTGTAARGTANPPLYDIERIEILRGPQGTYFGRNATGGAINVTTKKPTDTFYAQLDLGVGSFDTFDIGGVLNIPVTDTFFVRAALQSETSDGQVTNVSPLSDGGSSAYDNTNIRVSAHWDINDEWEADFSANEIREDNDMANTVAIGLQGRFGSDLKRSAVHLRSEHFDD